MLELGPGLWHWAAPHPDWEPSEPWRQVVSSYAIERAQRPGRARARALLMLIAR